jgi:hypothetical protein
MTVCSRTNGSLTLLACTQPPYHKKIVSQWLKLVRLNHLKNTPF